MSISSKVIRKVICSNLVDEWHQSSICGTIAPGSTPLVNPGLAQLYSVLFRNGATNCLFKVVHLNLFLLDFIGAIGRLLGMGAAKCTAEIHF